MTQSTPSMFSRFMGGAKPEQPVAKPLELVSYDTDKKKFEVGEEALAVLRATRGPVGVISVCGRARQGKSFILNQLLGQSSGFTVAPTHRPCTKGLWMWSSPQERVNVDGSKSYLVMLDTEGIDAWDQTGQYSVQIFSLAVLLSSLFVYNQMGGIDEAAVDRLSLVTEMTKHIRVRAGASKGQSSESELAQFTPSFLWLLRDFYLELVEDGRTVSPKEYLETALASTPETSASAKAKNGIRESIKSLFPDRDCFPLVRPISDEAKLARLESVPPAQLRPEFREGLSKLTAMCFAKAQPKHVGRTVITGPMLAGLVSAYVDAINGGAVPNIATAWQGVAEAECRRAADAAEQEYHRVLNHDVAADPESLLAEHQRALDAAKAVFDREAIGDTDIKGAVEKKWRESVEQAFQNIKGKRLAQASQGVAQLLNDMTTQLTQQSSDSSVSTADLMRSLKASLASYVSTAEGPTKWPKLVEHLQTALAVIVKRVEGDAARGVDAAQRAASDLKAELATAQAEVARLRASAGSEESKARALESQLEAAHQKAATDADRVRKQLQDDIESQARRMEAQVTAAQAAASAAQAEKASIQDTVHRLEGEKASMQRQLAEVSEQLQKEQGKANDLETKGTVASAEADERAAALQERVASLTAQLAAEKKRVAELLADQEAQAAALKEMQQQTEKEVAAHAMQQRDSIGDDAGPAGMDVDPAGAGGPRAEGLTIQEIKEWLTDNGHEEECWELANRKTPRVKKAEWVALMNSKQGA